LATATAIRFSAIVGRARSDRRIAPTTPVKCTLVSHTNDLPCSPPVAFQGNGTVLVVDDDEVARIALAELLAMDGFQAASAANGMEALEYLRNAPPPRLIILDLSMPKMDGWQFRAEQRRDWSLASIPIIVTTARPAAEASAMDADAIFLKPLDVELFLDVIRNSRYKGLPAKRTGNEAYR
jgi:CheY-like chemotaxis protein